MSYSAKQQVPAAFPGAGAASRRHLRVVLVVGAILTTAAAQAAEPIEYNKHIRPILAETCFACHGPDSAARKADLRLDQRDLAVEQGALVPGDPDASEVIARVFSDNPKQVMPPPSTGKRLSDRQKKLLSDWIAAGAEYQKHWSFIAPVRPAVPATKDPARVRNPIDNFIFAELDKRKMSPAAEADRRTLARRLSLDLVGLPPEPGLVQGFLDDTSPDAYDRLVDRLMDSQHWGEHRGRYWLDVARYADTHGIHFDNFREMWSYRDWVIDAFNRNLPFDRFTVEQLAGDLLPGRTLEQQIASGFNRCNMTTNEGGIIDEEYLVLYTRDRTETASQVWLGLTAGCAVCHDHKFDPLTQREFYELAAFFNNTTQAAKDGNIRNTPPVVNVPQVDDRDRWFAIEAELTPLSRQLDEQKKAVRPMFDRWLEGVSPAVALSTIPESGQTLYAPLSEGKGELVSLIVNGEPRLMELGGKASWKPGHVAESAIELKGDGALLKIPDAGAFDAASPFSCGLWVRAPGGGGLTGPLCGRVDEAESDRGWELRCENSKLTLRLTGDSADASIEVAARDDLKRNDWSHVLATYDGSSKAAGIRIYINGALQPVEIRADNLQGSIAPAAPFALGPRGESKRFKGAVTQDVRLYNRALAPDEASQLARSTRAAFLAEKPANKRSEGEVSELFAWWLPVFDLSYRDLQARIGPLERDRIVMEARGTIAHVMHENEAAAMAYILHRGEYDKRRDPVQPDTPDILPAMASDVPRNRLGFASWLLASDHPLTARVTVNRFWQEVFGTGLVRTAGDFGITGEQPSHPELLDWLAVEFRESGWDVKKFFKLLVTSSTYRQAAVVTPEKLERDPQNRLLSRGPRFRMDGEMIRDYALAASGLLVPKVGGPSVKPYQPPGVWEAVAMIGSNTRNYVQDEGDKLYRRSLYTFWKRAAPPALFDIFNAPSRETCAVRRERTNTPLQALTTLNDITFVEAARRLAERTLQSGGASDDSRLAFMAQRVLARPLCGEEARIAGEVLGDLQTYYQEHAADAQALVAVGESKADANLDPPTLAAWTMLANELMNLDEVLCK